MTFSSFLILLLAVYVLYYLVVILLDKTPAKRTAPTQTMDFVISDFVAAQPVRVKDNSERYMPLIDDDEEDGELDEREQTLSSEAKNNKTDDNLQSALRMETFSEETEFELNAEELNFQLA